MNHKLKSILITGIGDYIGLRCAEIALARGYKVVGIEASPSKANLARKIGAKVYLGNTLNKDILALACREADVVFHTEALLETDGDIEKYRQIVVDGTHNIAKSANECGVTQFIHLSSVLVYGFKYAEQISEDGPIKFEENTYQQCIIKAEKQLTELNPSEKCKVIVLRAGDIYGPGATTWILKPVKLMTKQLFALVNSGEGIFNHLYLDNLIDAVFLSIDIASDGDVFNITDGQQTTWKQFYSRLANVVGVEEPVSMPLLTLKASARVFGRVIGIHPEDIDFISRLNSYSIEKARAVLRYEPLISLDEGLRNTASWLENSELTTSAFSGG